LLVLCAAAAGPAGAGEARLVSAMAGALSVGGANARFISPGAETALSIDPGVVVKGDRLDIYLPKHGDHPAMAERVGRLVVVSNSGAAPTGKIVELSREIDGPSYVAFSRPGAMVNPYLPFLQSVADTYLDDPTFRALTVALIDMTGPRGHRTKGADVALGELRKAMCARSQFRCVDGAKLAAALNGLGAAVSRNLDDGGERALRNRLGINVIVTGHYRLAAGGVDLVLAARSTAPGATPARVWRRFAFSYEQLGADAAAFDTVSVRYEPAPRARLRARAASVATVEGLGAHWVHAGRLPRALLGHEPAMGKVSPGEYFMSAGSESTPLSTGGEQAQVSVPAGRRAVTFGYYLTRLDNGARMRINNMPILTTIHLDLATGKELAFEVIGSVERGHGIIAVRAEEPSGGRSR